MTLTILVSFSLLALVTSARPLSLHDVQEPIERRVDVQHAVQAIFESRTGHLPNKDDEDVQIHITSLEEQRAYLSRLDDLDEIRAVVPLGNNGVFTHEEKQLYNILSNSPSGEHLDDIDGGMRTPQDMTPRPQRALSLPADEDGTEVQDQALPVSSHLQDILASPPLLVLAVSSIAALLCVLCVGVALYTASYLRSNILTSERAWDILPKLEKHGVLHGRNSNDGDDGGERNEKLDVVAVGRRAPNAEVLADSKQDDEEKTKEEPEGLMLISFDDNELEEKFLDAEDSPLIFTDNSPKVPDLPRVVVEFADPELLPLPRSDSPFYTPPRTPERSPVNQALHMRASRPGSPVSIPAWSLRAADAPSFAIPESTTPRIPGALFPDSLFAMESPDRRSAEAGTAQRRVYLDQGSEVDIALALQLRPGMGLGADPAWLVRFLMSMFGWMTVLLGRGA